MRLLKTLAISLVVLLTACGTLSKESSTVSPSEDMLVICPRVDHRAPEDFGEALKNYDELLDLYTACRLPHNALVEFERKRK
jgi:hypothetical protein